MFTIRMGPRLRMSPMVLLLAFMLCGAEEPRRTGGSISPAHAARVFGEKRTVKGIPNFGEVTPTLYRGAQPSLKGFQALSKMGVEIVVDARGNRSKSEGKVVKRLGMKYVAIPWHCPFPHDDVFARFVKLLKDNPHKKVFVHCRLGDDRTGMMIASYRMAVEDWSANDAMLEMEHFGFTRAHHFICPRLAPYEQSFPKRLKNNPAFRELR
jgi:tyrosine-protein phosphatase SIW14